MSLYGWFHAQAERMDPPPVPCAQCGKRWLMRDPSSEGDVYVWGWRLPVCPLCLAKDWREAGDG